MSGGSNQQYPPMGGGMGGGPQSGGPPMITGGPYQGPPQGGGQGGGQGGMNQRHWQLNPPQPGMGGGNMMAPSVPGGWSNPMFDNKPNIGSLRPQQPGMGGGMPPIPPGWGGGRPEHTYWPQPGGGGMPGWNDAGRMPPMNIPGQRPNWPGMGGDPGYNHPGMGGGPSPPHIAQPPRDRWAGLGQGFSEDQFMKARGFADRGKMGRARQAIQQGGGQWSPQLHGLLSSPSGQWGNMGWNTMA